MRSLRDIIEQRKAVKAYRKSAPNTPPCWRGFGPWQVGEGNPTVTGSRNAAKGG